MMGIVHHSNYIRFLEEARCALLEEQDIPMSYIEEKGYTIPTIEVNCKYKTPVTQGDIIAIGVKVAEYNGVKMTIEYDVKNTKTGNTVIEAYTRHCFTNKDLKPVNIRKHDEKIDSKFLEMAVN
jgi:acyl-CoA thioester hydrolase